MPVDLELGDLLEPQDLPGDLRVGLATHLDPVPTGPPADGHFDGPIEHLAGNRPGAHQRAVDVPEHQPITHPAESAPHLPRPDDQRTGHVAEAVPPELAARSAGN